MVGVISFLIFVMVGKVQELFLPEAVLSILKPALWGLVVGILGQPLFGRKPGPGYVAWRPPTRWFLWLSLGLVASLPMSIYPSQTFTFLLFRLVSIAILFFLVVRNLGEYRRLERTSFTLVWVVILLGMAVVVCPTVARDPGGGPDRTTVGFTFDANDLAVVLVMSLPILFYWFWRGGVGSKVLTVCGCFLALYGIYRTGSRGGLLSLGVAIGYMVVAVREAGWLFRSVLAFGMLLGGAAATQTSTFQMLVDGLRGKDYNARDEDGRLAIWRRGIGYIMHNPVTGVGAACFETADGTLSGRNTTTRGIKWSSAHNSFIQVAAEAGIITFSFWLLMLLASLRELARLRRRLQPWVGDREVRQCLVLASMVRCSLISYLCGGFFLSLAYLPLMYLMVAFSVALANAADHLLDTLDNEALVASPDEESLYPARSA